jgi:hypothetical protein
VKSRPWVLVTDGASDGHGQSRPSLGAVRALGAAGYRVAVTVSTRDSLAAASRYCRRKVRVPDVHTAGYVEAVREELARGPYLTMLATSDTALIALGAPGAHLIDKGRLQTAAQTAGLPFPPTEVFATGKELLAAAHRLSYPVIVKPAVGKPPLRAGGPGDLAFWAGRTNPLLVQPYLTQPIHTMGGVMWRDRLAAVVHQRYLRTWPPEAGMALAAETIEPDLELEAKAVTLLQGFEGVFELELSGGYLFDVNPRVYGSIMLSVRAGANLVGVYCDLLRGEAVPFIRGRPGAFYRWLEADVRYVASGLVRRRLGVREAAGMLRPRWRTAHGGPESLSDPGPLAARFRYALTTGGWGTGHQGLFKRRKA